MVVAHSEGVLFLYLKIPKTAAGSTVSKDTFCGIFAPFGGWNEVRLRKERCDMRGNGAMRIFGNVSAINEIAVRKSTEENNAVKTAVEKTGRWVCLTMEEHTHVFRRIWFYTRDDTRTGTSASAGTCGQSDSSSQGTVCAGL